jgi:hypothetical protein
MSKNHPIFALTGAWQSNKRNTSSTKYKKRLSVKQTFRYFEGLLGAWLKKPILAMAYIMLKAF